MTASRMFRNPDVAGHNSVSTLELFFDLVYVFALTQIAAFLAKHLTVTGFVEASIMLMAVWWAWNYTTWMSNWFDPHLIPVRLTLIFVMGASLLMAVAIPTAFTSEALLFAGAYVAQQVGRNAFNVWTTVKGSSRRRSFTGILIWSIAAGAVWIAGALAPDESRLAIWALALFVDMLGPMARYWIPGQGTTDLSTWEIDAEHFAERFKLLMIIALGEMIIVIASNFDSTNFSYTTFTAFITGFLTTVALWWLYFDYVSDAASMRLEEEPAERRGILARDGYTYLHLPILAGFIIYAVSFKLILKHPLDHLHGIELAVTLIGPVLYLVGHNMFRHRMVGTWNFKRLIAMFVILGSGLLAPYIPAYALSLIILGVLVVLVIEESITYRRFFATVAEHRRPRTLRHIPVVYTVKGPERDA